MQRTESLKKTLMLGKIEMVGWHHQLNEHEFEQALDIAEGQGSLVFCSPWGCKQLDTSEQLK